MFHELDHALRMDEGGIREYQDGEGLANRISEWLATPVYTVADNPGWGHLFRQFWHDPESPELALQVEMSIARKLPRDVRDIRIRRVGVEFSSLDRCVIEIIHDAGRFQQDITFAEGVTNRDVI